MIGFNREVLMRTLDEFRQKLADFEGATGLYCDEGYIAWRRGTGDNLEMLLTEASEKGQGFGTELFRKMIYKIEETKEDYYPYYTVYDWILGERVPAQKFFEKLGFKLFHLGHSVYRDDDTILAVIPYAKLKENLGL